MTSSKVSTNKLAYKIEVPSSKSYANRALVLAAIHSEPITVKNISWAQDVLDMVSILKRVGLEISLGSNFVEVKNSFPECEKNSINPVNIDLGEGGTTARFLVGMLSLGKNKYNLNAQNRMTTRPMSELYDSLNKLGVKVVTGKDSFPVTIQGPVKENQSIEIDCSETTQFYSSLLLISKKVKLEITPKNLHTSKGYVEITKNLIDNFSDNFTIPVDFSSASYPIAFACLNQGLVITNCLEKDQMQGDSIILDIIKDYASGYTFDQDGLHVYKTQKMKAFSLDCKNCPDLVPTLCYLAAYSDGETTLINIANLKHKESDRISGVLNILKIFDVKAFYDAPKDELKIVGTNRIHKKVVTHTEYDHRMVMAMSLFLKHNGGGEVSPAEAVTKSFPGFFEIFT